MRLADLRVLLVPCSMALCALAPAPTAAANEPLRFETDVLPVLARHCGGCHGAEGQEASLDVRSLRSLRLGGDSGPAITPGQPEASLLLARVVDGEMPPEGPGLSEAEIEILRRWIADGALGQRDAAGSDQPAAPTVREAEVLVRVFFTHCISCHGREIKEAGLDLRTRDSMVRGGKSGPAIIPGDPDGSLVLRRLIADEMPPKKDIYGDENYVRRVPPDDIELVRQWIAAGAPSTPHEEMDADSPGTGRIPQFWSFKPPTRPEVPRPAHADQVRTPIDAFILEKLESVELPLSPQASNLALMRRAYFDLIGLPPTPEEVAAYIADKRPDAYERMIDRLLASPHYGERWAQHWLDAAGYADSHGKIDRDQFRPFMWRYRDYVIRSLQADKPFDQFLTEQIAGDELAMEGTASDEERIEWQTATGFLLTAADATDEAAFNSVPQRMGVVAEQIDIFSTAVMGLTLECARCHSHKFDPISQRDYYRFSAIFQAAFDPYDWRIASQRYYPANQKLDRRYQRFVYDPADKESPELALHRKKVRARVAELEAEEAALVAELQAKHRKKLASKAGNFAAPATSLAAAGGAVPTGDAAGDGDDSTTSPSADDISVEELIARYPKLGGKLQAKRGELAAAKQQLLEPLAIAGVRDLPGEPTPVFQLRRGDPGSPTTRVGPGVPAMFDGVIEPLRFGDLKSTSSNGYRLALARWLTQPQHPLTARVLVNRVWQHHFGRGLVTTPGNFGAKGARPSHPELLDWLATEFVREGWSLKRLHRLIMCSNVYRQSSLVSEAALKADPDNVLLSRYPLRRLDGEAIRDALLSVSGALDPTPFGPPDGVVRLPNGEVRPGDAESPPRRSIYLAKMRLHPLTLLEQFDAPEMTPNCLQRTESTVPTQALQLLNSDLVRRSAEMLAERVMASSPATDERGEQAYLLAFGRPPTADERRMLNESIAELRKAWDAELARQDDAADSADKSNKSERLAWTTYCHAMLNAPKFVYVD